jgi:hypothetical protein
VTITPVRSATMTVFASRAFHVRNQRAIRAGVAFRSDEHEYGSFVAVREGLPAPDTSPRRTRGFLATLVVLEERPVTFQNFRRIGRTEDYNAGWTIAAAAGYFAEALDGTAGAPYGEVAIQKGLIAGSNGLLVMDASAGGRHERDGWRNASGRAALTEYAGRRGQTIAAQVALASSTRPDVADWLYLGGRDGLRGYVDHFLAGDRRITLSLEDRIITSWRPLGLVQAGFVAYLDAGAIRRADTGRWSRLYANIGGGLRFGASKSGGNLIQISIATPLVREPDIDRLLLVLGNAVSF